MIVCLIVIYIVHDANIRLYFYIASDILKKVRKFVNGPASGTLGTVIYAPSWMAAKVATAATMAIGITDRNAAGTVRKSRNPVSLLADV